MHKTGKGLMFGPLMPFNTNEKTTNGKKEDMGAMTDLVRALRDVDASPENIDRNKHGGTGTVTKKEIKLSEDSPQAEI